MDVRHSLVVAKILALGGFAMLQFFGGGSARLVNPNSGTDDGFGQLEVGRQQLHLVAAILEAVPIVGRSAGIGVVEVLQFVGPAYHAQHLIGAAA